jgi:hypothetical protein
MNAAEHQAVVGERHRYRDGLLDGFEVHAVGGAISAYWHNILGILCTAFGLHSHRACPISISYGVVAEILFENVVVAPAWALGLIGESR